MRFLRTRDKTPPLPLPPSVRAPPPLSFHCYPSVPACPPCPPPAVKPENFLLESKAAEAVLKLTDFGLSCAIPTDDHVITDACGSAYYIAPEIFSQRYTKAVDVWSVGVILYLLLSGGVPFGGDAQTENDVYTSIQRDKLVMSGRLWERISSSARELVQGLLEKDPAKRYTLAQALAHPWVTGDAAPDTPLDAELLSSIMSVTAANKFKKRALELVASTLSAADVASLRATFVAMDKDNSGSLTHAEVSEALRASGLANSADAVMRAVKNMDTNGDGKVSWNEFLAVTQQRQLINYQQNMWYAFQMCVTSSLFLLYKGGGGGPFVLGVGRLLSWGWGGFHSAPPPPPAPTTRSYDKDGDGKITVDELREIFKGESREKVQGYITEFDKNGDGCVAEGAASPAGFGGGGGGAFFPHAHARDCM